MTVPTGLLHCCTMILMASQFCLVTMVLYHIIDTSHIRLAWCCQHLHNSYRWKQHAHLVGQVQILDYGMDHGLDFGLDSRTYKLTSPFQVFPPSKVIQMLMHRCQSLMPRQCIGRRSIELEVEYSLASHTLCEGSGLRDQRLRWQLVSIPAQIMCLYSQYISTPTTGDHHYQIRRSLSHS